MIDKGLCDTGHIEFHCYCLLRRRATRLHGLHAGRADARPFDQPRFLYSLRVHWSEQFDDAASTKSLPLRLVQEG